MITIDHLLKNISLGQSVIPTKLVFSQLNATYNKIKSGISILKAEEYKNGTIVYMNVPSESDPKKHYDVVFYFNTKSRITKTTEFKVYSNSPKFGYSYAYLFNKKGALLFPEKYPRIMLTQPPKVRNPYKILHFDKHVYAALVFIFNENLSALVNMSKNTPDVRVSSFEEKLKEFS